MTKAEHIARRREILRKVKESLDRLERTVPCVLDQIERVEDARWRRVVGIVKQKQSKIGENHGLLWNRRSRKT